MKRFGYTSLFLALAVVLSCPAAHAQPSAADRESARSLMNEGDKKLAAHDARGAMKAYQTAHEIMKVPSTGASYAQAALEAGFFVEARDACLQVARLPVAASEPAAFQKARSACTDLVPRADAKIATITIRVAPMPGAGEAKVSLDGAALLSGALLVPRKVNPGKHVITASLANHDDERTEVTAGEAATIEITLTFKKTKASGIPPVERATTPDKEARPTSTGLSPLVYVGFGVGAAGLLVGGLTGGLSVSKAGDAKEGCVDKHCPRGNQDAADSSRTFGTISTIGIGVGIVGVGVGVGVYGLLAGSKRASTATRGTNLTPIIGASSLGFQGQF